MNESDCYFEECKDCINRKYNNEIIGCLANRLSLTFHRLLVEMPIINKVIDDNKYCYRYEKE